MRQDLRRLPRKGYAALEELDIYLELSFFHWRKLWAQEGPLCVALCQSEGGIMSECSCSSDTSNMVLVSLCGPWVLGFSQWCLVYG